MQATLRPWDETSLSGLRKLILALDGKVACRLDDQVSGTRLLHRVSAFLVQERFTLA